MNNLLSHQLEWKVKHLIIIHICAALLMLSWLFEPGKTFWLYIDQELFWFFNDALKQGSDQFRYFWAATNMKNFDRVVGIILLAIFIFHAIRSGRQLWGRHIGILVALLFTLGIWTGYGTYTGIGQLLPIERLSPTLEFGDSFRIEHWAGELKTKDSSSDSFPGDHGMILLISSSFFAYYFSRSFAWFGFVLVFVGTLPRVYVGAHWVTDEVVGAIFIALLAYSWNFHTPLGEFIVRHVDQVSRYIFKKIGLLKD